MAAKDLDLDQLGGGIWFFVESDEVNDTPEFGEKMVENPWKKSGASRNHSKA